MKAGWEIKKLGEVATFQRGLTYSKSDEVEFSNNCVLRSNNIELETMSILLDELKYIREDLIVGEDKKVKKDTILICMSNGSKQHIGKVAYIDKEYDYAFGGFMGLIKPNSNISPKFMYYSCLSSSYKQFLASVGNGANITNIKFSDLSQFSIPIPPLSEQEQIVAELDLISGIIEKKKQQLKELDSLAQSVFYEMFGNPVENDKGWEVKKLGEVCDIICGQDYKSVKDDNGKYPIYGTGGIMGYASQYRCPANSIIIGRKGNINNPLFVNCEFWNVDTAFGVVPNTTILTPIYFFFFCKNYDFTRHDVSVTIPSLRRVDILKIDVAIPPLSLQQEFASKIESIEKQKELIKQSLKDTETLFNSRMDFYFN